jgi:alpha-N-arabinofuranosidase
VNLAKQPVWIEGPHLFKKSGWYYLICAEGGTGEGHSEVVFRSLSVRGPYVPWAKNPILTQRTLDPRRPHPVTCTGHADFVETTDGAWWTVFLGCRPYEGNLYNTGRETFMLLVTWTDGWPIILPPDQPVPAIVVAARLPATPPSTIPLNGNFTWRDEFDRPELQPVWNFLRAPGEAWFSLRARPGALTLQPREVALGDRTSPSFLGHRQQHGHFTATTAVHVPLVAGESAGVAAFQNETHYFFLGIRRRETGLQVFLERASSLDHAGAPQTVANSEIPPPFPEIICLKIEAGDRAYSFSYGTRQGEWQTLKDNEDGSILSTAIAGGFVGTYVGPFARIDH